MKPPILESEIPESVKHEIDAMLDRFVLQLTHKEAHTLLSLSKTNLVQFKHEIASKLPKDLIGGKIETEEYFFNLFKDLDPKAQQSKFHEQALLFHPDRNKTEEGKQNFINLSNALERKKKVDLPKPQPEMKPEEKGANYIGLIWDTSWAVHAAYNLYFQFIQPTTSNIKIAYLRKRITDYCVDYVLYALENRLVPITKKKPAFVTKKR